MDMHDGDLTSFKHQSDYITTIWQITIKLIQSLTLKYMWLGPLTNYLRQSRQLNCVAASPIYTNLSGNLWLM